MATTAPAADEQQTQNETPVERLFRYSAWIHEGPGAQNCDDVSEDFTAPKNDCGNPLHFHAWVRLPNQWQHEAIREKALAAKGRRSRVLRDPATDAYEALEEALESMLREGEPARERLIEELLEKDRWADYATALREVQEKESPAPVEEGDEPLKLYSHVLADQERFDELVARAEHEPEIRDSDEYTELRAHLEAYTSDVGAAYEEVVEPKRQALRGLPLDELVNQVREERIRKETALHFMSSYSRHEWLVCTYFMPGGERRFKSFDALDDIAPEVFEALRTTFDDLENAQNAGVASGNS